MGEVVVSSEGAMELEAQETMMETEKSRQAEKKSAAQAAEGDSAAVSWERFLPNMAVRVLLVEADDSTRQIISALLRKCSYRVAAVGDGLKAWEVLKGRPCNVDLILTEVELPSISGYALLTLIMEHEVCKNIPVIMMSSQDSVSTVYKCMLRGATDFLVKPLRKNELRNLWQHVWRKQASSTGAGLGPPDGRVAEEKDDATSENNAVSNHSSGIQINKEGIEKGNDAQSSCTTPKSETEGEDIEHGLSQPKSAKHLSDGTHVPEQGECHQQSKRRRVLDGKAGELQAVDDIEADHAITQEDKSPDGNQEWVIAISEYVKNDQFLEKSSKEAIDLIGAFDDHLKGTYGTPALNVTTNKFNIFPLLDLSLKRSHLSGSMNQVNDERSRLNHSDASPFYRYVNKPLHLSKSTPPSTCNQQKEHETISENQPSNQNPDYNSDMHVPIMNSSKHVTIAPIQTGQPEFTFPYSQSRDISHLIPVRGVRFENVINAYGTVVPSAYSAQSGSPPLPSPSTTHHTESLPQSSPFHPSDHQPSPLNSLVDQRISGSVDQMENKQGSKLEEWENGGLVSPGNDQSVNNNFCNGNISHHQSTGSGSNSKVSAFSVVKGPSECGSGNEETFHIHEGASHRSMRREAALTKFRLKRKDRCFEKKVRYESRKKLAEQRPRVKGQFVRQVPTEPQPGNSSAG